MPKHRFVEYSKAQININILEDGNKISNMEDK